MNAVNALMRFMQQMDERLTNKAVDGEMSKGEGGKGDFYREKVSIGRIILGSPDSYACCR